MNTNWANEYLQDEAKRIINLLKNDFVLPSGEFFLEKNGDYIFSHHIFPDLGDFLPFFIYFKEDTFIDNQIALYLNKLKNGILISEFPSFKINGLAKSYEYTDLLFGLLDYHKNKNTITSKKILLDSAETAIKIFKFDGNICSFYHQNLNINIPILDTRDGTFIEIYLELYSLTKDRKYIKTAHNIYTKLINTNYYKKNKLLPTFSAPNWIINLFNIFNVKKFSTAIICKNNTNSLFGFLSLYIATKDENILNSINEILNSIESKTMTLNGGIKANYSLKNRDEFATLTSSFPLIDFLSDLYRQVNNIEYINLAQKIADFWINLQGLTGLFPLHSNEKESFLDSETDMCISLLKLYEITRKEDYKISSNRCLSGIINFHGVHDYVLGVNIDTGKVLNNTQRTKFIALFLKLIILKIESNNGKEIYKNNELLELLKDR